MLNIFYSTDQKKPNRVNAWQNALCFRSARVPVPILYLFCICSVPVLYAFDIRSVSVWYQFCTRSVPVRIPCRYCTQKVCASFVCILSLCVTSQKTAAKETNYTQYLCWNLSCSAITSCQVLIRVKTLWIHGTASRLGLLGFGTEQKL